MPTTSLASPGRASKRAGAVVTFFALAALVLALSSCGGGGGGGGGGSGGATTTKTTRTTASGGASAGRKVFASAGCGGCHTLAAAGSNGQVGPNLDKQLPTDARRAGKPLAAFVRESIVKPNAYIAKGFKPNVMPQTFGKQLSNAQIAALVAFIAKGR